MQLIAFCSLSFCSLFQSTHPHGVRLIAEADKRKSELVSIHAPTWGATFCIIQSSNSLFLFQSTHPHGVRPANPQFMQAVSAKFQSTHPHGVRLLGVLESLNILLFQSTHPHGVRLYFINLCVPWTVSIHAPTWGATQPNQN